MAMASDILRGYTDTILLCRLSFRDSYGYEISKIITAKSGGALEMKEATLYTAFRRMESTGLIESYWGDEQSGARRRYYRITDKGMEKAREDLKTWEQTKALMAELLILDDDTEAEDEGDA